VPLWGEIWMIQMWIDITFLGLVLTPIFILFVALYQNLLEVSGAGQKTRQKRIVTRSYMETERTMPVNLRVVK